MKDINLIGSAMLFRSTRLNQCFFYFFIIWLAACPLWGQANNGVFAYLENNKAMVRLDSAIFDKPMLFVRHGMGQQQVVWSRQGEHILLSIPRIPSMAGVLIPVDDTPGVESKIIGRFPVVSDKSMASQIHIDITTLLLQTAITWNWQSPEVVLSDRSFVERVLNSKNETIIKTKRTIANNGNENTLDVAFSFYTLPEPMKSRLYDHRMGFYFEDSYSQLNFAPRSEKGSIQRWRLEKRYPEVALSEPIKPITFYLDPNIPDKWKPYIKAGVLEWLPAFEMAGFKNAILIEEAPSIDELNYINSIDYPMIRWINMEVRGMEFHSGGTAKNVVDLRSGEILKSDIILNSTFHALAQEYIVRCAPMDVRAQQYPLPDDLIGAMLQYITAHEAGHAFGLMDANFGEYAYPIEKMRNKEWLSAMGHTPGIMTYARQNYIAQPEDSIPPSLLIQKVGPMDAYQIKWGYMEIPETSSPLDELPILEKVVREQDSIPWLRTNRIYSDIGPASTNEVVDNNNPIESTRLGLKNLQRVLEILPRMNERQPDNALLDRLYIEALTLWYRQMIHVMSLVGGITIHHKSGGQPGAVYTPVSKEMQQEALEFLLLNAFDVPSWLSQPEFMSRIRYSAKDDTLLEYQKLLLSGITDATRLKTLAQMEESPMFKDVSQEVVTKLGLGLFEELDKDEKKLEISPRRRELQLSYIGILSQALFQDKNYVYYVPKSDERMFTDSTRGLFLSELLSLRNTIKKKLNKTVDSSTVGHLKLCLWEIEKLSF